MPDRQVRDAPHDAGGNVAQQDTQRHRQEDPERQVAVEEGEPTGGFRGTGGKGLGHRSPRSIASAQTNVMGQKKVGLFPSPAAGDPSGQPLLVLAEDLWVAQAGAEAAEQDAVQPGLGLRQAVVDPESLLAPDDQPVLAEVRQVPGDGRLGDAQGLEEMADAHLVPLAAEQVQEAQAHGVGERLERPGGLVKSRWCLSCVLHSE